MTEDYFSALSWFRRDRVAGGRIMVIGCGALGNEVLKSLAMFGVGRLTLVDFDTVEDSNLCRSVLFREQDEGRLKVEAAADGIRRINPAISVDCIAGDAAYDVGLGLWSEMDVVIGCVDSRWARYCINRNCMRTGVSWVDGGIGALDGTARVFVPGRNCYACNLGEQGLAELRRRMPCSGIIRRNETYGRVATTPISASIIAAVQVQEALKLLHGEELDNGSMTSLCGRMFYYEGEHFTGKTVRFGAWDENCPCHDRWSSQGRLPVRPSSTVRELLDAVYAALPSESGVYLSLRDDCFVDYVSARSDDRKTEIMLPGRLVEDYVEKNPYISKLQRVGLYQNEWTRLDRSFPYSDLTLKDLGIPPRDILHIVSDSAEHFFETE